MESHRRPGSAKESIYTALLALLSASIVFVILLDSEHIFPGQWTYRVGTGRATIALLRHNISAEEISAANYPRHGYIVGMRYSGQQGAGVSALFSLQRWVRDVRLPMVIVEPFIQNSVLGAHRKSFPGVKFSDMFDLEKFNSASRTEGVAELVPWEIYLARSPANAILVKTRLIPRPGPVPPPEVEWSAQRDGECWRSVDGRNYTLETHGRLCYVRVVLSYYMFVSSHTLSAEEVCSTILGGLEPTAVTIVFALWRAPWKVAGPPSPLPASCAYAAGGEGREVNKSVSQVSKLQDSPRLLRDVENYQKQFLTSSSGRSYVAVMLRGEHAVRMLYQSKRASAHFNVTVQLEDCLEQAVAETSAVLDGLGTQNVFVTADVGLYGSNSWLSTMSPSRSSAWELDRAVVQIKQTVERMYKSRWTFDQWEKSFSEVTQGVEDRGYIAALQRAIASQAACLVLFGGGSFHILALRSYVDNRGQQERCVHFVCIDRKYKRGLYELRDGTAA